MRLWSRSLTEEGLATALVGPATLSELAAALEPSGGHVMLSGHSPLGGAGWIEAMVPLTPDQALQPDVLRVSRLQFDALLATGQFLDAAERLRHVGGLVRQFAKPPRHDVSFDDRRAAVRMSRYRAFDLRVGFDLPHARESALIFSVEEATLSTALSRLGLR
jgi:hypothetical protein